MKLISYASAILEWGLTLPEAISKVNAMIANGELEYDSRVAGQTFWRYTGEIPLKAMFCERCKKPMIGKCRKKFCSMACARLRDFDSICKKCGKRFKYSANREKAFCSEICEYANRKKNLGSRYNFGEMSTKS